MKRRKKKRRKNHFHYYQNKDTGRKSWSIKGENGDVIVKGGVFPEELSSQVENLFQEYREMYGASPPADMNLGELLSKVGHSVPTNESYINEMAHLMKEAGISPEIIYAFQKTDGLLVTEFNQHLINDKDLVAWQEAIDEYLENHQ